MPKRKDNRKWIAPIIIGGIVTAALVLSGLHGLWREWWVEWLLIPASLAACSFGVYEFFEKCVKNFPKSWAILISIFLFVLIGVGVLAAYKSTSKNDGESIPENVQPVGKSELKPPGIAPATAFTNLAQKKADISDDDNPATSGSIYLNGQTVVYFSEIYKDQPKELAFEASNQLANHHPKCSVYLFEKAESYYENDPSRASSGWRQRRPDYALALFLTGREEDATDQLHKFIGDIKSAISNPSSPLSSSIYQNQNINKTLDGSINNFMQGISGKPIKTDFVGTVWNEYNLLRFQISTNKF